MVKWHPAEDRYIQREVLFLSFNVIALAEGTTVSLRHS
jgi:hypothetical protein